MHPASFPQGLKRQSWNAVTRDVSHALRPTLARFPIFASLEDDEVSDLARAIRPVEISRGDALFRQGEAGDAAYLVDSGRLRVSAEAEGVAICVAHVEPGEIVGELALIDGGERSATVVATRATRLLRIDGAEFDFLRRHHRAAAYTLLRGLARTLAARQRATNDHIGRLLAPSRGADEPAETAAGLLGRLAFWRRK